MWKQATYFQILSKAPLNYSNAILKNIVCCKHIDKSKVPQIVESDLEEQFVRGSGPGGQAVSKTSNAVVLKHIPSGLVIKNHVSRSLEQNRKMARIELRARLDNLYNGEMSVSAQMKRIEESKSLANERKARIRRQMKEEFKKREGLE